MGSAWMQTRLSDNEGLEFLLAQGGELSPLFAAPFMALNSLRLDWLHVADQGVDSSVFGRPV